MWNILFVSCFITSFITLAHSFSKGDVRLMDGTKHRGRVEVFLDGKWTRVCDYSWGYNEANVVCRQLGFSKAQSDFKEYNPRSSGQYGIYKANCNGNESTISDCAITWGGSTSSDCQSSGTDDAGVLCSADDDGRVRLRDHEDNNNASGRVEITIGGEWRRVCYFGFGWRVPSVICRQLGFPGAWSGFGYSWQNSRGSGPFWIKDVDCHGKEKNVLQCSHSWPGYTSNCDEHSYDDLAVLCQSDGDGAVRIHEGGYQGRAEIFIGGGWRRVCGYNNGWDINGANVFCRQLGYEGAWRSYDGTNVRGVGRFWVSQLNCAGNERRVLDCYKRVLFWDYPVCAHDAGLTCIAGGDTAVRLVDGNGNYSGRVEVRYGGLWRRVCEDGWSLNDAQVVCRQLGFGKAMSSHRGWTPRGDGQFWLSQVNCTGTETELNQCLHQGIGEYHTYNCKTSRADDAAVVCDPDTASPTRPSPVTQPPIAPGVKIPCKDLDGVLCEEAKRVDHCSSPFAKKHCCESCTLCRDATTACPYIKAHGMCDIGKYNKICCRTCTSPIIG